MKRLIFTFLILILALLNNTNENLEKNTICPENCRFCIRGDYCLQCNSGYFVYYGTCLKCNQNCKKTYSNDCTCEACNDGYYLNNY